MKKFNIIFVLMALVLCVLPFVYATVVIDGQFHWSCLIKGEKLPNGFECTGDCCIVCQKNGYNNYLQSKCNGLPYCSCGGGGGGLGDLEPPVMTIYSPTNNFVSGLRGVLFNITINEESNLYYSDDADPRRGFKKICVYCKKFDSKISFNDGPHIVTIKAVDKSGNEALINKSFFIDSKKPKITKTLPAAKGWTNGTFIVQYDEENIENARLFYNQGQGEIGVLKTNCPPGRKQQCTFVVPGLSQGPLAYHFKIEDRVNSVESKEVSVNVDTFVPIMTVSQPLSGVQNRTVQFDVDVNKNVTIEYIDNSQSKPKWTKLCSKCDDYYGKKSFGIGSHSIEIRATDLAGNSVTTPGAISLLVK